MYSCIMPGVHKNTPSGTRYDREGIHQKYTHKKETKNIFAICKQAFPSSV